VKQESLEAAELVQVENNNAKFQVKEEATLAAATLLPVSAVVAANDWHAPLSLPVWQKLYSSPLQCEAYLQAIRRFPSLRAKLRTVLRDRKIQRFNLCRQLGRRYLTLQKNYTEILANMSLQEAGRDALKSPTTRQTRSEAAQHQEVSISRKLSR
jgi:hypothetical protein